MRHPLWIFQKALWFAQIVLFSPVFCQAGEPAAPPTDRRTFAAAMSKVTVGMPEAEVLALLGPPDDVRTATELAWPVIREIWRYGTDGHLTPATLGEVRIDHRAAGQSISARDLKTL